MQDQTAIFLDWCKMALLAEGFVETHVTARTDLFNDEGLGSCYAYWEAIAQVPFKDCSPRPPTAMIGPLTYSKKEIEAEIQIIQGAPTDDKRSW